jgi:GNAT superfamily N-acetyltransferase
MSSTGIRIPALDPPWPDDAVIMAVTSQAAPGWLSLADETAAAAQPGGRSFPLRDGPAGQGEAEDDRAAFLYRHADLVAGYLCLASKIVTGYRSVSAGDRHASDTERVIMPCVMVVWVDPQLRRRGVARQLVFAAAQYARVKPAAWPGASHLPTAVISWPSPSILMGCGSLITAKARQPVGHPGLNRIKRQR